MTWFHSSLAKTALSLTSSGGSTGFPIKCLSCHSNTTKLTMGSSPSGMSFVSMNLVRMKGSRLPPQSFLEYMPEHTCRFESFSFCQGLFSQPPCQVSLACFCFPGPTTISSAAWAPANSCSSSRPAALLQLLIFFLSIVTRLSRQSRSSQFFVSSSCWTMRRCY